MSHNPRTINSPSLAASRPRRSNAGVPPEAFDSVAERLELRNKRVAKQAKAATTIEIESNPLTGDDSPERDPLEEFQPPTRTGDPEFDQIRWEEARTKWLIPFLAKRDAVDVRPALNSGRIGLPELEEIHDDPDAAVELLSFDIDQPNPHSEGKGKMPVVSTMDGRSSSKNNAPLVQTGYTGISIDRDDYIVRAKHTPKAGSGRPVTSSGTKRSIDKGPNTGPSGHDDKGNTSLNQGSSGRGLQLATTGRLPAPLCCTDSTTLLDGERLALPVYHSSRRNISTGLQPPQSTSVAKRVQPIAKAARQAAPNFASPVLQQELPAETPPAQKKARLTHSESGPVQEHHPKAAAANELQPGHARTPPPQDHDMDEVIPASDGEPEQAAASKSKSKKTTGKATIKSFPEEEQPIVERMSKLAKAYIIANGPYDDSPTDLTTQYKNWPDDWKQRKSRTDIVSMCLMNICRQYDVYVEFVPRHVQCVTDLIRTHHTGAADRVKPLVDHAFGFTVEMSDHNKSRSKGLLPFNFHYLNIPEKRGPFEHPLIGKACRAIAFHKSSAVGPKNDHIFDGTPVGYLAYTCAMIHYVLWSYRSGEFSGENLNADIQAAAFRRALRYLITTHKKKAKTLQNIRYKIYDQCMMGLEPKSRVHDPSPEPEREWTPDTAEEYVRHYKGHGAEDNWEDTEMGGCDGDLQN
ncbi:hypothetical protein RhiJN_15068 [Ceratobasidium sp. AG-Ba]|nr:hypothetical protein RhiJN_15068 [Ceratobasidium sp. AG-Ba]